MRSDPNAQSLTETAAKSVGPGEVLCLREEEDTETADRIPKVTAAEASRPRTKIRLYPGKAAMLKDLLWLDARAENVTMVRPQPHQHH